MALCAGLLIGFGICSKTTAAAAIQAKAAATSLVQDEIDACSIAPNADAKTFCAILTNAQAQKVKALSLQYRLDHVSVVMSLVQAQALADQRIQNEVDGCKASTSPDVLAFCKLLDGARSPEIEAIVAGMNAEPASGEPQSGAAPSEQDDPRILMQHIACRQALTPDVADLCQKLEAAEYPLQVQATACKVTTSGYVQMFCRLLERSQTPQGLELFAASEKVPQ